MMSGYKRGNAKQRGAAALAPLTPRSEGYEFRDSNFECAIPSFTLAQSSGSQSSDFERVSQPTGHSELEPGESAFGGIAREEFGRRRVIETSVDWGPYRGECSGLVYRPTMPLQDASTQTDVLPAEASDQIFASLIPRQAMELMRIGSRFYAPVSMFIVLLALIWHFTMNRGSCYYVKLEVGGFGMD